METKHILTYILISMCFTDDTDRLPVVQPIKLVCSHGRKKTEESSEARNDRSLNAAIEVVGVHSRFNVRIRFSMRMQLLNSHYHRCRRSDFIFPSNTSNGAN